MKECPFCCEEIQDRAIKCKHCGEMLNAASEVPQQAPVVQAGDGSPAVEPVQATGTESTVTVDAMPQAVLTPQAAQVTQQAQTVQPVTSTYIDKEPEAVATRLQGSDIPQSHAEPGLNAPPVEVLNSTAPSKSSKDGPPQAEVRPKTKVIKIFGPGESEPPISYKGQCPYCSREITWNPVMWKHVCSSRSLQCGQCGNWYSISDDEEHLVTRAESDVAARAAVEAPAVLEPTPKAAQVIHPPRVVQVRGDGSPAVLEPVQVTDKHRAISVITFGGLGGIGALTLATMAVFKDGQSMFLGLLGAIAGAVIGYFIAPGVVAAPKAEPSGFRNDLTEVGNAGVSPSPVKPPPMSKDGLMGCLGILLMFYLMSTIFGGSHSKQTTTQPTQATQSTQTGSYTDGFNVGKGVGYSVAREVRTRMYIVQMKELSGKGYAENVSAHGASYADGYKAGMMEGLDLGGEGKRY